MFTKDLLTQSIFLDTPELLSSTWSLSPNSTYVISIHELFPHHTKKHTASIRTYSPRQVSHRFIHPSIRLSKNVVHWSQLTSRKWGKKANPHTYYEPVHDPQKLLMISLQWMWTHSAGRIVVMSITIFLFLCPCFRRGLGTATVSLGVGINFSAGVPLPVNAIRALNMFNTRYYNSFHLHKETFRPMF